MQILGLEWQVDCVERNNDGRLITHIRGKGLIQEATELVTDFIVDTTGLIADLKSNPLLKDMVKHYDLEKNPKGRMQVANDFEVTGLRNGLARTYACGIMTLGGPYAPVDTFLGLQYTAQKSVDALINLKAPHLRKINGLRSCIQWLKWAGGKKP